MKTLITFILTLILLMTGAGISNAMPSNPCVNEDGSRLAVDGSYYTEDCYWDAQTRGNGQGHSFYIVDGVVTYTDAATTTTAAAPTPTVTIEAQAWAAWDATNAASLLPAEGGQVSLIGHNYTGFPYLAADLITVWDEQGNHYLFQIS